MLLNNLHALRVHTQGIFEDMGGEEVGKVCAIVRLPHLFCYALNHYFLVT